MYGWALAIGDRELYGLHMGLLSSESSRQKMTPLWTLGDPVSLRKGQNARSCEKGVESMQDSERVDGRERV